MKKLIALLMLVFGLWIVPAMADPKCELGAQSFTETMEMAKAFEIPVIVIQGEGLDRFAAKVAEDGGPEKPAELTQLVAPAEAVKGILDGTASRIEFATFTESGCPYSNGTATFSGDFILEALKAALDLPAGEGI